MLRCGSADNASFLRLETGIKCEWTVMDGVHAGTS